MYAIIYFKGDKDIYPLISSDKGYIKVFNNLQEADDFVNIILSLFKEEAETELRVISLDSVHE